MELHTFPSEEFRIDLASMMLVDLFGSWALAYVLQKAFAIHPKKVK
jgi:hypothetical protein